MNGLSGLSGPLPRMLPPQGPQRDTRLDFPFPDNMAGGLISNALMQAGSESASHRDYLYAALPDRKPPRGEGFVTEFLVSSRFLSETGNRQIEADIDRLKNSYIFRNESAITRFMLNHRTVASVLSAALPELKSSFGEDVVFNLEAVSDDDECTSLYAIVVWRGPADGAESALEDFDERWWLNQPAQPGLTFTYELA